MEKRSTGRMDTDGVQTVSSIEQRRVERDVSTIFTHLRDSRNIAGEGVRLLKEKHLSYLTHGIRHLSSNFECLDSSRPWLCYWIVHSMSLLGRDITGELSRDVVEFLKRCQSPCGGFGGGPGQLPHLAPTYAAVLALCTIGTMEAYSAIDRPGLQRFLYLCHQDDGSFIMHQDGEVDIRGTYCALVAAMLTNTMTTDLFLATASWVSSCQTYEGGFSAIPGTEAHGGYTFCGFAAAVLLKATELVDMRSLLRWICRKQMKLEGGFQGRTNKLVDGCYSFWQGGVFPLICHTLKENGDTSLNPELWMFNQEALQEYILYCCQSPHGGLIDKPGKMRDFYHTCYCLSGLSVAQHCYGTNNTVTISLDPETVLKPTHPVYNIRMDKVKDAHSYFSELPAPQLVHYSTIS